jgi:tRNA(fMet)-specific endonuclease VapC
VTEDTLVDSDLLIAYLRAEPESVGLIEPLLLEGRLTLSVIVYAELLEGIRPDQPSNRTVAPETLLSGLPIVDINPAIARRFAEIRRGLRATGMGIPDHDIWIAATALEYDLTLLSRDRQFDRIPDLRRVVG